MRFPRSARLQPADLGGGLLLRGHVWSGDGGEWTDGAVAVSPEGIVAGAGAAADVVAPAGARHVDVPWVGPGIVDEHVHLAFGDPAALLRHGVVAARDLGAPPDAAMRWRTTPAPRVRVAGPVLTAPGGYPSRSWGSAGFAAFVDDPEQTTRLVSGLALQVDVVKLALEPRGGPVPTPAVCAAVVEAAHAAGREVTCHALEVAMVERALDAGVDELAHTPVERLPAALVDRIAAMGVRVVSTLHTVEAGGDAGQALANARDLVGAGVSVRYGTDLGNTGVRAGADPRELELLECDAGLGPDGALRAATEPLGVGSPAALVGLGADPRERPTAWRTPLAVVVGTTVLLRG